MANSYQEAAWEKQRLAYQAKKLEEERLAIRCIDPARLRITKKQTNCVICDEPIIGRGIKYCSTKCADNFYCNHQWTAASNEAQKRNRAVNFITRIETRDYPEVAAHWHREAIPAYSKDYTFTYSCCSMCLKPAGLPEYKWQESLARRLEVDHILPMNGGNRALTCMNHQENLRVICHECHLEVTKEQRRAGLIGKAFAKRY